MLCRCEYFSAACELFRPTMYALIPCRNAVLCCKCNCFSALPALPDLGCPSLEHEVVGEVHLHRWQNIRLPRPTVLLWCCAKDAGALPAARLRAVQEALGHSRLSISQSPLGQPPGCCCT